MTSVLSKEGQMVLPDSVSERLELSPGGESEIFLESDDNILLRRVPKAPNSVLVDLPLNPAEPR